MIKHRSLTLVIAAALAVFGADAALARKAAPKAEEKPAAPSQPVGKLVEYTELEQHVGSSLVIETTFGTVRRGTLIKYTNPGLTLQLGAEHGSVELSVPRETIRNVSIVLPPAEVPATTPAPAPTQPAAPAQKQSGASSAKKN